MKTLLTSVAFVAAAGVAHAATLDIDFETGYSGDVTVLANGATIAPGVTVTSSEAPIQVVKVGPDVNGDADGFVPLDTPLGDDEPFGEFFLTGDLCD